MTVRLNSQADFDAKLAELTSGIRDKKILKDDMTLAKKGGAAWAILSFFCKILTIDLNKHYRPKVVVPNMKEFFKSNMEFITDEARKNAVCDVMRALDRAMVDKKGNRKYHKQIVDDKRVIKYLFAHRNPDANAAPSAPAAPVSAQPVRAGGIPVPPPPPPPPPARRPSPADIPARPEGHGDLMGAIRRGTQLRAREEADQAAAPSGAPSSNAAPAANPSAPAGGQGLFGGINPVQARNNLRPTPVNRRQVQTPANLDQTDHTSRLRRTDSARNYGIGTDSQ